MGEEVFRTVLPTQGRASHPTHGMEKWFAYGAISGVEGTPASGVAQAYVFEDGTYLQTIQLNIEPAPEGYFYEGWAVNDDGSSVVSTGHIRNLFGDARHMMEYSSEQDLQDHLKVIVTLEPDDGDPAPAAHVAEGTLRVTQR